MTVFELETPDSSDLNDKQKELDDYMNLDVSIKDCLKPGITEVKEINDLDLINWWKRNEKKFPRLALIAQYYLTIPLSSAQSERAFSSSGNSRNSKRTSLSDVNLGLCTFLAGNRDLFLTTLREKKM